MKRLRKPRECQFRCRCRQCWTCGSEPSSSYARDSDPGTDGALKNAKGAEFDRLFLTGMIQHHNGALVMVKDLFGTAGAGQDAEIFNFATDVDNGQRAEINRMQTLLGKKP